jgi:hypothetical protein
MDGQWGDVQEPRMFHVDHMDVLCAAAEDALNAEAEGEDEEATESDGPRTVDVYANVHEALQRFRKELQEELGLREEPPGEAHILDTILATAAREFARDWAYVSNIEADLSLALISLVFALCDGSDCTLVSA